MTTCFPSAATDAELSADCSATDAYARLVAEAFAEIRAASRPDSHLRLVYLCNRHRLVRLLWLDKRITR
jgi:hypothetical protein